MRDIEPKATDEHMKGTITSPSPQQRAAQLRSQATPDLPITMLDVGSGSGYITGNTGLQL